MVEIFKVRANMVFETRLSRWVCRDENDNLICDGGPSIIWEGGGWNFFDDILGIHRLDGPATSEGNWFINDKLVTDEILGFAQENNIDLNNLSDEDKVLIALKFS